MPLFIEQWVIDGKLVELARGDLVWSEHDTDFVAPTPGNEERELLQTVYVWSEEALYQIQKKREGLLSPLNIEEDSIRTAVSSAFDRLTRANAAITAHLNSLREVQDIQDEVLRALRVKDLRDTINEALDTASKRAAESLDAIRTTDARLDEVIG